MTTITKTITTKRETDGLPQFQDFPPRDDMQNWKYLYRRSVTSVLEKHLVDKWGREVVVMNEVPIGPSLSDRYDVRIPDMMVAFDPDLDLIIEQKGFEIIRHDKPPEFTLEVASLTTGPVDYTDKRLDYERYGNEEFLAVRPERRPVSRRSAGGRPYGERQVPADTDRDDGRRLSSRVQRSAGAVPMLGGRRVAVLRS